MAVGIPSTNENNWAIGQMLANMASKMGFEVNRSLTEKTDPNPKVAAPHCIAHYPIEMFDDAVKVVSEWWGDRSRQMSFFDAKGNQE